MIEITVVEEGPYAGREKTLAILKFARVPIKGDYLIINKCRHLVKRVEFFDTGEIVVTVS